MARDCFESTRGLRPPEQLERAAGFPSSGKTRPDSPVPTLQGYNYTVEVRNRFKGLDMIDRVPDELWMEVRDIIPP